MKLHRLKILTGFRGLAPGFEIRFNSSVEQSALLEPICFVGLNGSGKSNVLEVLSEIFYYLETYHLADRSDLSSYKAKFGFEIEYSLPKITFEMARVPWPELSEVWQKQDKNPVFKISKQKNKFPEISASFGNKKYIFKNKDNNRNIGVLPARVIGYSSGMNELISNPFIKMDFHYLDAFEEHSGESSHSTLDMNRMFFMDYDSNKLITICNFLFDVKGYRSQDYALSSNIRDFGGKDLSLLKETLGIQDLHSFSISLHLRDSGNKPIDLPSELNITIDNLKKCATCFEEKFIPSKSKGDRRVIELYFWVNKATKKAFRYYFKRASALYRQLYFLRLLNNYLISKSLRKKIKKVGLGFNISSSIPRHEEQQLVFTVKDIALKKTGVKKPVYYQQLSDGEHQLLHILGTIILMDTPGTLFILDEPETHFNPEWRSKFVSYLNNSLGGEDKSREQEIILTSHSPFIVSDCKPDKVFSFYRKEKNNRVAYKQPDFNTFGASVNLIMMKVFDKQETISGLAQSEFERIRNLYAHGQIDSNQATKEVSKLGDSIEKTIFLSSLSNGSN